MLRIRKFRSDDTRQVADLIARTFRTFNGREYFRKGIIREYLDQYDPVKNPLEKLRENFSRTPVFYVATEGGRVVGMIRGNPKGIGNLFVSGSRHRKGIGGKLVAAFERRVRNLGSGKLKVRSTIYATPFYQAVGYRKTTGVRNFRGHKIQPMAKNL